MTYYQLLKKRRLDLNLSIQNVSSQTRLAPEYIQAIEEHNLDVFSDDFSFVRYFVHAYCDAIGVNWNVVQEEVDADIHAYARMRNHALTQAQRRIVTSMKPETTPKIRKKKKKRSTIGRLYSLISYKLLGRGTKYSRLISFGIVALLILGIANAATDVISNRQQAAYEKEQQEEYQEKEKETEQLAKQYQQTKEAKALKVTCQSASDNVWLISNLEKGDYDIKFDITLPNASIINLYRGDTLVSDGENAVYSDNFKKAVTVQENCIIELQIGTYSENVKIYVDGNEVNYQKPSDWNEGEWAVIRFKVQYNGSEEPKIEQETDEEEQEEEIEYLYDEEAGVYYYYDENTGEYVYLY